MRVEEVEIYYDPGELFAGLLKGTRHQDTAGTKSVDPKNTLKCPLTKMAKNGQTSTCQISKVEVEDLDNQTH